MQEKVHMGTGTTETDSELSNRINILLSLYGGLSDASRHDGGNHAPRVSAVATSRALLSILTPVTHLRVAAAPAHILLKLQLELTDERPRRWQVNLCCAKGGKA